MSKVVLKKPLLTHVPLHMGYKYLIIISKHVIIKITHKITLFLGFDLLIHVSS